MDGSGGFKSSANYSANFSAPHGRGRGRGGGPRGRGNGGRGQGRGGRPPFNNNNRGGPRYNNNNGGGQGSANAKVTCQICGKPGHNARDCWNRYREDDQEEHSANAASYGVDTNWYMDSGATDHITSELEKVTIRDKYRGQEQIHTANGAGMKINHIGHSVIKTPIHKILLNNILHVPDAYKNLLSVNRITIDNHAYVEFWPKFFLIKDQVTRKVIYRGRCRGGLYPLIPHDRVPNKQAFGVTKVSSSRWHSRLGHPSFSIVERVLRNNKLPFHGKLESVCDSCQKAKSHQLPYSISTSVSTAPLELVFSDVWGPAPISVGRHNYYVSFIDDFSKFTWIYLIKRNLMFLMSSIISKHSSNENLGEKLLPSNPIGEVNMKN
jgi:histone deacetylase 1/2